MNQILFQGKYLSEEDIINTNSLFNINFFMINYCFSENSIRKMINISEFDWDYLSAYQNLSKEFIAEFADKINFYGITNNKNISDEVKEFCRMFL